MTIPVDRDMAHKLAQAPENVDKTLWLYELCRFLTQKVNSIIVALFSDNPACSSITCPEMRASEWQYLCAVHDPPKSCCAIDYCCHTLDWAANTLTSPKHFPSRLALGTDQSTQHSQMRQLTNIFRRVYRIFAHAWFQHRDMFWKVEGRTGLYVFYKTVCDVFGLIPDDNYTVPAEAEGIEPPTESRSSIPPLILKREPSEPGPQDSDSSTLVESVPDHTLSTAGTTKRHRHSPSVGATSVHTVVEENEEEEERPTLESRPVTQIFESANEEDDTTVLEEPEKANDEAETAAEPTSVGADTAHAADESEGSSASQEKGIDTKPQETVEESEEPSSEQAPTETSEPEVSGTQAAEAETLEAKSNAAGEKEEQVRDKEQEKEETKPDAVEPEKAEGSESTAKPLEKTEEDDEDKK